MESNIFELNESIIINLIKEYKLLKKIFQYPEIKDSVYTVFKDVLKHVENIDEKIIEKKVSQLNIDYIDEDELKNILTLILFCLYIDEDKWDEYINLARKKVAFKELAKIVSKEGATYGQIVKALKKFCDTPVGDMYLSPSEVEGVRVALINYFISNQLAFISVAKNHITVRDINDILERTYRSKRRPGKIGGKAAGMYLAYRILVPRLGERDSELEKYVTIPESYFFNSGIFSEFIDYNDLYEFHTQKYKTLDEIQKDYEKITELFKRAKFPEDMVGKFREFLERVGEHPLILRSSSLLEDNFGYAFSGKYDSVFLANQGDLDTRLEEFIWGLKKVHMSTYSPGAIIYRRDRNLLDFDEKMSVLVQKVVGRQFGKYFLPTAAGVGFSYSSYTWSPKIDKSQGMVRLVFGLGTRAVDRVGMDYPRMIYLSHPTLRPEISADDIYRYSQKFVDVIDLKEKTFKTLPLKQFLKEVRHPDLFYVCSIREQDHISPPLFKTKKIDASSACITFDNFINKTNFISIIKKVLKKLEEAYKRPVDVEFAWDENRLYILQCRSLSVVEDMGQVEIPEDIEEEDIIFTTHNVLTSCKIEGLEYVVYVDPKKYSQISSREEKLMIGRIVGKLNRRLKPRSFGLFGPGRWGSNDINLGVRVNYEDINNTRIIAEVAFSQNGTTPEVSYGTHFFSDLVEANIIPIAIFPDQGMSIFKEEFFKSGENLLLAFLSDYMGYEDKVFVKCVPKEHHGKYLNIYQDSIQHYGIGFLR